MDEKKKRQYNFKASSGGFKKKRNSGLECGLKGFLCTTNFREKECVREAYNILNEFLEKLEKPEDTGQTFEEKSPVEKPPVQEKDQDDISSLLSEEIDDLKSETSGTRKERKFQVVDTGIKNLVFIKAKDVCPLELALMIFKELYETKVQKTRHLLRLIPVQVVCKPYLEDIKSKSNVLFEKYFSQEPRTFAIVFNRHGNSNLSRDEVIEDLADLILKKNPGNKADLKNPEISVVVEVVRGHCLVSIAPDYFKYKKYNLLEICKTNEPEKTQ